MVRVTQGGRQPTRNEPTTCIQDEAQMLTDTGREEWLHSAFWETPFHLEDERLTDHTC